MTEQFTSIFINTVFFKVNSNLIKFNFCLIFFSLFLKGFKNLRARKPLYLSEENKAKRMVWALENLGNSFENYVFIDESISRTLEVPLYHWRVPGSQSSIKVPFKTNQRAKINIFGAISWHGASQFIVSYKNTFFLVLIKQYF